MDVVVSEKMPVAVKQVWEAIRRFDELSQWHPAVSTSEGEDDGKKRRLVLADGSEIVEELVEHDEGAHAYTYTIVKPGPLPVQNYKSTIKVEDDGKGNSKVTWSGSFEPTSDPTAAQQAIQNVYQSGLDNLRKMMGG